MTHTTGAEFIIHTLQQAGVRLVAGMPGGANLPLYDALGRTDLAHVLIRHEQAAGFIAQGIARASGGLGVCFATSGPGATNLLTAMADARRDSIPVLAITGQVSTDLLGTAAFQEIDTPTLFRSVTKGVRQVQTVEELPDAMAWALQTALSGRPGPVLLDVPKDVQKAILPSTSRVLSQPDLQPTAPPQPNPQQLAQALALLAAAERPVLYVGGGLQRATGASAALTALAERNQIPVASTLMGLGLMPSAHPLLLGMLGMHAAPYTNLLMRESDLLLAIGVRFDDRATGKLAAFCPDAKVVHVDIDPAELGKLRKPDLAICADGAATLQALAAQAPKRERSAWLRRMDTLRQAHPLPPPAPGAPDEASLLIECLSTWLPEDALVTTDVGQHQMWVAQRLALRHPRQLLTSGGLGTMGFGLPAAIGAALTTGRTTVCVTGDGSLSLSLPELATLAEQSAPVKILVLDNGQLGMVRQQQKQFFDEHYVASHSGQQIDFVGAARALGLPAIRLPPGYSRARTLHSFLREPGPALAHVPICPESQVLPIVPPGAGNHEMICHVAPRAFSPWDAP